MHTYNRMPMHFTDGKGAYLTGSDGKRYLDFLSGIAVTILGHQHPAAVKALTKAAHGVWHTSNLFEIPAQISLGEKIAKHGLGGKTFFCNSGTEANEAALKLAVKRGKGISPEKTGVIAMINSFHGRTIGSLNLTGQEKYRKDYPALSNISYVPYNDMAALTAQMNEHTAAVFIEVVQGEAGVYPVSEEYYRLVRSLTKKFNALMIIDEVQTGMGRTGTLFGYERFPEKPDVFTLAKGLANGFPIGAMHAASAFSDVFTPGSHASTFGGNPLAVSVGNAVFDIVADEKFLARVRAAGETLRGEFAQRAKKYHFIKEIRGQGLMIGVELSISADAVKMKCFGEGLIVNAIADRTLRLIPPLIIGEREIAHALAVIDGIFKQY